MNRPGERTGKRAWRGVLIGFLVLGSVWGFLEVVVGGGMRAVDVPYKGDILTGLGIGLMALGVAVFRRPLMLIAIAATAVGVKQLAVPILHLPVFCKANSCLAVMLAGTALAGTVAFVGRRLQASIPARVVSGISAALLAATGFYFIGMRVAPCRYLLSFNRPGGFAAFMVAEGLIWAALGGVFFPVGYRVGEVVGDSITDLQTRRPVFYYTASAALVASCWVASAIAIASGL